MSVPATAALAARDQLTLALDRAAGARPIEGNRLEHHPDSPRALDAMLAAIVAARHWVHFENYIIRDDATGRRFADALAERARAGVRVRVLYDALGSFGTSRRYWRRLTQAGAEVRAFHPLLTRQQVERVAPKCAPSTRCSPATRSTCWRGTTASSSSQTASGR